MRNTEEYVLGMVAERTKKNTTSTTQPNKQRRNLVTDDFDKEYETMGNKDQSGKIYLSISPDIEYMVRWEFKLIVEPFYMPVASSELAMQPVTLKIPEHPIEVDNASLSVSNNTINPNPHKHTATDKAAKIEPETHTHVLNEGVTLIPTKFEEVRIFLDGVDLTSQFKAQFPTWISPENGMYPDLTVGNRFDILKALNTLDTKKRTSILRPGYHVLEFKVDDLFSFKIREFKRYSGINRQGDSANNEN